MTKMTTRTVWIALFLLSLAACGDSGGLGPRTPGGSSGSGGSSGGVIAPRCAEARLLASDADKVPGVLARGVLGDVVLENPRLRSIIQKPGRNWFNIGEFGGNLIDAVPRDADGALRTPDALEEMILGVNIENTPNYQSVEIISPGGTDASGNCQPAVVRATGPDDLFGLVNASSAVRGLGLFYPPSADDADTPLTIQTDYTLDATSDAITITSTLINNTAAAVRVYLVEYTNVSGNADLFQTGYGFGDAFVTTPCTSCTTVAWQGKKDSAGMSYGLVHNVAGTSTVATAGVSVAVYGRDFLLIATTPEQLAANSPTAGPNFTVPANGSLPFTRHFVVGHGAVSTVMDVRNQLLGTPTGTVVGTVRDSQGPVAGAQISVISNANDFPQGRGPSVRVANQLVTDAQGQYRGSLPAGSYQLRLNGPNRLAGTPSNPTITVAAGATLTQDFTLPLPARVRVTVVDENGAPIAAKVQLIGNSNSPDSNEPQNSEAVAGGVLTVRSGVFVDPFGDPMPPGMALTEFAVADSRSGNVTVGDTGTRDIEPGSYQLSVSHGPRYDEFSANLTLAEGALTTVPVVLHEVVPTPGYVAGDFHVHSFLSLDADVEERDRVATYLAEGLDFFTPSDHEIRVDFAPTIAAMGVAGRIASAPAGEITTLDYGHFIGWPVALKNTPPSQQYPGISASSDPSLSRGSVDLGVLAPPGDAFPSKGHYQRTPREVLDQTAMDPLLDGRNVVRQINHVYSFFGAAGMRIDTGQTPPRSSAAPAAKRLNPAWVDSDTGAGNFYTDAYDTLELWIGADGRSTQSFFVNEDLGDWFNLINQGRRRTGMSNSDSHTRRLTGQLTRNLIPMSGAFINPNSGRAVVSAINADPHGVGDAVIAGRNLMTNGPFVRLRLRNAANQNASLEPSDTFGTQARPLPLASANEAAELAINVQAPTWATYDRVMVYVNGHTVRQVNQVGQATTPARYNPCPGTAFTIGSNLVRDTVTLPRGGQRFESGLTLPIPSPGRDYWLVVRVEGRDGVSPPIWPIDPASFTDSGDGLAMRSAADRGMNALAVTNPIFVDADGDGVWTPPGVMTHSGSPLDGCPGGGPALPAAAPSANPAISPAMARLASMSAANPTPKWANAQGMLPLFLRSQGINPALSAEPLPPLRLEPMHPAPERSGAVFNMDYLHHH